MVFASRQPVLAREFERYKRPIAAEEVIELFSGGHWDNSPVLNGLLAKRVILETLRDRNFSSPGLPLFSCLYVLALVPPLKMLEAFLDLHDLSYGRGATLHADDVSIIESIEG